MYHEFSTTYAGREFSLFGRGDEPALIDAALRCLGPDWSHSPTSYTRNVRVIWFYQAEERLRTHSDTFKIERMRALVMQDVVDGADAGHPDAVEPILRWFDDDAMVKIAYANFCQGIESPTELAHWYVYGRHEPKPTALDFDPYLTERVRDSGIEEMLRALVSAERSALPHEWFAIRERLGGGPRMWELFPALDAGTSAIDQRTHIARTLLKAKEAAVEEADVRELLARLHFTAFMESA